MDQRGPDLHVFVCLFIPLLIQRTCSECLLYKNTLELMA